MTYWSYNARGQVECTWGTATYPTYMVYDEHGAREELHTFRGGSGWDGPDEPSYPQAAGAAVTTWEYDPATGLLTGKVDDEGQRVSYTYTLTNWLFTRTWARGTTTTYGYDGTGALTNVIYSDSTPDVTYVYDRLGRLEQVTDAVGTRDFVYDGLELDTETIQGGGLFADDVVLERTYDDFGRDGGLSVSGLYDVGYDYDVLGRLDEVTMSPPVGTARTFAYSYVPGADFVDGYTESGSGLTVDRTYATDRNVLESVANSMGATSYSTYSYRYDDASRRTHFIVEDVGSAGDYFYAHGYNSKSELVSSDRYAGNDPDYPGAAGNPYFDYDYDHIGNRETSAVDGSTRVYTTNDLNQYTVVTTPSQSPIYDVDGNLTEDGAHEFAWDGENRLIQVADVAPVGDIETRVSYAYDYLGRMVRRHVERYDHSQQNPSWVTESVTLYVYDGWRMVLELNGEDEDAPLRSHYWGLDLSGTLDGAAGIGGLLATVDHDTPTTYFVLCDGHGNVTQLVDASDGSEAAEFEYDPYGNRIDTRPDQPLPFGFSTKFLDPETGLYYYGFRWYQAEWGRWVSRDPIDELGSVVLHAEPSQTSGDVDLQPYLFSRNSPAVFVDPDGRTAIVLGGVALTGAQVAALAGAIAVAVCSADPNCRKALAQAVDEALAGVEGVIDRLCRIRCRFARHPAHHPFLRPTWRPPFIKTCWFKHVQVNCWLDKIKNSKWLELRLPYGPCYKFPYGAGGVTH